MLELLYSKLKTDVVQWKKLEDLLNNNTVVLELNFVREKETAEENKNANFQDLSLEEFQDINVTGDSTKIEQVKKDTVVDGLTIV